MKKPLLALTALTLTGCSTPLMSALGANSSTISVRGDGTDTLGGLSNSEAAHASVEAQAPTAFVLTSNGTGFVAALDRNVKPLRTTLASTLAADTTVMQGLNGWSSLTTKNRLAVLQRVAALEGQVMNCQVPPVVASSASPPVSGMMAFYQPGDSDIGQVTLYSSSLASGDKYLALATLVHEMRHAAQFQMVLADQGSKLQATTDEHLLATNYAAAWSAMDSLGGESDLAYGDYVHLDVEFDAFQTGNEVASLVSGGSFDATGSGFVDVQYSKSDAPVFDLSSLMPQFETTDVTGAVNLAEYQLEHTRSTPTGSNTGSPFGGFPQQRSPNIGRGARNRFR